MAQNLVIVESPAKAKTINKILGRDFIVKASMGHVRDLPQKNLGINPEKGFQPKYVVVKGHEKIVSELKQAAAKSEAIYLAPDPDREGEAIAWHLKTLLAGTVPDDKFFRVTYNEITPKAVRAAFANVTTLDMNKVNSQQARRILDRIVGYKVSPLLWSRVRKGLSAGRVQSVALRILCEREEKIAGFVPEPYWVIGAKIRKKAEPKTPFTVKLFKINGEKADIKEEKQAADIMRELERRFPVVSNIATREISKKPYAPYITSSLQQSASSVYGLSPARTMSIAQQLYEGINLGSGETGLITYMRTDSFAIAADARAQCRQFIEQEFGKEYLPETPNFYKSKAGAQEAHEAIRPTDVTRTPQSLSSFLNPQQMKLYKLIWERFVASQMTPARIALRSVDFEARTDDKPDNTFLFRASASTIVFPGYMKVSGAEKTGSNPDNNEPPMPPLDLNERLETVEWLSDKKETQPPTRYSEASLIKALEEHGIGRPSTYAQILSTLNNRNYVSREKRSLTPTELGIKVNTFLVRHLDSLFNVGFTADMEEKLDAVEKGSVEWTDMLAAFYKNFSEWVETAKSNQTDPVKISGLLELFNHVTEWSPAVKNGKREYSDNAFVESVKQQFIEGKKTVSARQENVLIGLVKKYESQIPDAESRMQELGYGEQYNKTIHIPVRETTFLKLKHLESIKFDPPVEQKGKVRDDKAFIASLKAQAESGKSLSPAQLAVLNSITRKYADQIPDFEKIRENLGLETAAQPCDPATGRLIDLMKTVSEWKPPVKRGKREWSDESFYNSLARQFSEKGALSPKQLASLRKMIPKYASQIPDYENTAKELGLAPEKPPKENKAANSQKAKSSKVSAED